MNEKKKLRRKVLEAYHALSDGNVWKPVSRSDATQRLELNSNDEGLLAAIAYLEDVGYLKVTDNGSDQITAPCIDELEAGYPSFPGA
jgi:hypothetical protein